MTSKPVPVDPACAVYHFAEEKNVLVAFASSKEDLQDKWSDDKWLRFLEYFNEGIWWFETIESVVGEAIEEFEAEEEAEEEEGDE